MKIKFKLPETDGPEIEVVESFWRVQPKVLINGVEIKRLKEKGKPVPIPLVDGSIKKISVRYGFDFVPKVIIEEKELPLLRKLYTWEWVLGYAPAFLLFLGGAIGGALGGIATMSNLRILRFKSWIVLRIVLVISITFFAVLLFSIWAPAAREYIYRTIK